MSDDLDQLLRDAGGDPGPPSDADQIWRRGRQRRRRRMVGASVSGVAVVALLAVLPLTSGSDLRPVIDPMAQEGPSTDDDGSDAADPGESVDGSTGEDSEASALAAEREAAERAELERLEELHRQETEQLQEAVDEKRRRLEEAGEAEEQGEEAEQHTETPVTPDPERVDDPCADHEGGEMRVFIDVVSPVEGQQVDGEVGLIGCASVYEGTVQYRVVRGEDDVLLDGFTTATAGGPDIGEFRETISLPDGDDLHLEVYWEDAASGEEQHPDGPERDLVRIALGRS